MLDHHPSPSFSPKPREILYRSRGAAIYFLMQGLSVSAWWILLLLVPHSRIYFRTSRTSDVALLDFIWPDLFILGLGSCLCAGILLRNPRSSIAQPFAWMLVGATIYPALYVCGATFMSGGEGWAASLSMLFCAFGSFLAAWTARLKSPLFRVAPERARHRHITHTFIQTSFFWFLSLMLGPWLLTQAEKTFAIAPFVTPFQSWLPWLFFAIIGAVNLYTGFIMSNWGKGTPLPLETARVLVIRGPYRYVRNPMAISGLSLGLMIGWWLGSWFTILTVFLGGFTWHFVVRPMEEKDLEDRFGAEYTAYKKQVPNWLPTVKPAPPSP